MKSRLILSFVPGFVSENLISFSETNINMLSVVSTLLTVLLLQNCALLPYLLKTFQYFLKNKLIPIDISRGYATMAI